MASAINSLAHEVEAAVSGGDVTRRMEMLRNITNLFTSQAARLDEAQVAAFDTVILRLATDIEGKAREELAEQIADIANAPRETTRNLALDISADVASPILQRSSRLEEGDLIAVAERRGQAHLMALTKRTALSTRLTDLIVERGDQAVIRSAASNTGAAFSSKGYSALIDKAENDRDLRASLEVRANIPPLLRTRLIAIAQERVEQSLSAEFGVKAAEVTSKVALFMTQSSDELFAAEAIIAKHLRRGDLDEAKLLFWLSAGQETEALVGLARLAGVPSQIAVQAYAAESYEPLLFLVRSAKLGWRLMKPLLTAKDGSPPTPELMQSIMDAFQALSVTTAQRVVRFTAARDQV